ncbi:MAG: DUF3168 domain-containing protein [Hyphomicrobium sp.]
MANAGLELQKSVFAALSGHAALTSLLGGARIYDDVPRGADYPYVTLGESTLRDWSTGSDTGDEHVLTVHVWSRAAGRKQLHEIMGTLRGALHEAALMVTGHRLINLRHEFSDARREPDGETYHGVVRYRAVTEVV